MSTLFLVKGTFFDFELNILSETKMTNGLEFKRNRNDNVAVLHTTSSRTFQRSQDDINCKDVKPCRLGLTLSHALMESSFKYFEASERRSLLMCNVMSRKLFIANFHSPHQ